MPKREPLYPHVPKSRQPSLPRTKSQAVTITCPICGKVIEIPEYNKVTRSDALGEHLKKEHAGQPRLPQVMIEGGEPVPPQYRDLIEFISEPVPEYSLMTLLPAVEAEIGEKKIDVVMKQLKAGVEGIQESYQFRLFLTTMAKFHDYSIGNQILIMLQRKDATHVAGFNTWKDLGRWVKKGERGISILAPVMPPKPKPEEKTLEEEETIEPQPVYFKVVYVFDIAQTEGKLLPEFEVPVLTGEANEELFYELKILMRERGVTVSFESRPYVDPGIKGQFTTPNQIWVRPEEPPAQQLKTLLHESAHYYSAGVFRIPRADAETIAESAAYVVGAHYGFDTGVRSFPYVALWGRDKKVLQANLGAIRKVATTMLEGLEK
jgi:antirestriction protein ArdC